MLISWFRTLQHPKADKMVLMMDRNGRRHSRTQQHPEQHKSYAGKDDHGSREASLTYGTNPCTGRSSREDGDECVTGQGGTSCSIRWSSVRDQGERCDTGGWTYLGTRRYWPVASSGTSLKGMASRRRADHRVCEPIYLANME
jgi:hypothetical protein